MPLKLPKPPGGADNVLREYGFAARGRSRTLHADSVATGELAITQPHRVYVIGRDAILRDEFLNAVRPVAWRYLLVNSDAALAAAEIGEDENGSLRFLGRNDGTFVQGTIDAVNNVQEIDEVKQHDFELRLLRIPFAYLVALWLHNSELDLLVPLPPTVAELEPGKIYGPEEVLTVVKPYAIASARFDADESA